MLSGPAILRISVLLILAGALAALVQFLLPATPLAPVVAPPIAESPVEPASPPPAVPAPPPKAAPAQPPTAPQRKADGPAPAGPPQMPVDALAFPPAATPTPAPQQAEAEVAQAENTVGPRAVALLDLNTASVADLNRLQGGGAIGRAIVSKRPYASVDQLLTKRVLSRAVYDRIRQQVTVR